MRACVWTLLLATALAFLPGEAMAGGSLLPLLTVQIDQQPQTPWWTRGDLQMTPLEGALVAGLRQAGASVVDPAVMANPPRVSRIYRVPVLSRANAANLAGLYGAGRALVGQVAVRPVAVPEDWPSVGVEAVARVEVIEVGTGATLVEAALRRQAWGDDAQVARARAEALLAGDLAAWLAGSLGALNPPVGLPRDEPFILVGGLPDRATLDAVVAAARALDGVSAVRLAWLTEGGVALEINPDSQEDAARIQAIADALRAAPPEGLALIDEGMVASAVTLRARRATASEAAP